MIPELLDVLRWEMVGDYTVCKPTANGVGPAH